MVLGQEPKIYLFLGVYSAEDIFRLCAALCFFVFFRNGSKENLHRLKKILKMCIRDRLRDMGYERVELMDTTDGSFMTPKEAKRLMLRGSTLLVGRK